MTAKEKQDLILQFTKFITELPTDVEPIDSVIPNPDCVEMLTIKECTQAVKGVGEYTIRRLVRHNEIPYYRTGESGQGKILIPKSALLNYFK